MFRTAFLQGRLEEANLFAWGIFTLPGEQLRRCNPILTKQLKGALVSTGDVPVESLMFSLLRNVGYATSRLPGLEFPTDEESEPEQSCRSNTWSS